MKPALSLLLSALVIILLAAPRARADAAKGEVVYKGKCAMCHGPDGKGQTPMGKTLKLRDLGSDEVQAQHDSDLKTLLEKGKGKMQPFKGKLAEQQLDDVIQYMRTLKKK